MQVEDGVSKRLWIEKPNNQTSNTLPGASTYTSHKLNISDTLAKKLQPSDKDTQALIHSAFAILLTRYSSSNIAEFNTANGLASKIELLTTGKTKACQINITSRTTKQSLLKQVKSHLQKKRTTNKDSSTDTCYLLLSNSKIPKNQALNQIDLDKYSLIFNINYGSPNKSSVIYNKDSFHHKDIAVLIDHFVIIFGELLKAAPSEKVAHLEIITKEEKTKILEKWRTTKISSKIVFDKQPFHNQFVQIAKTKPNNIAISHEDESFSYSELYYNSNAIIAELQKRNIQPGDRVCVIMSRSSSLIAAMIAIFRCGAIFVPINPKYPEERVRYVLDDAKPSIVLINDDTIVSKDIRKNAMIVSTTLNRDCKIATPKLKKTPASSVAYIVYTSGTTGNPKGVMIQHKSLVNFIHWYKTCFNTNEKDIASQFASQGFDSFFCETLPFLAIGASISIVDDSIKLTPNLFLDWLKRSGTTVVDLTTAYAQILFYMPWPKGIKLRLMKIGGEALSHYPNQKFCFDIWNIYGPTEATIEATFKQIYKANTPAQNKKNKETPPIGRPIINSEIYIVDQNNQLVPPGVAGELLIGGDNISPGYYNRSQTTRDRFTHLTINGKKTSRLYKTGDMVKWLDDGNLEFVGRIDHQVKIRGYRIEPSEIQHAISLHPDVKEVAVIAKDAVKHEKSIIAYVMPNIEKERFLYQQRCLISINKGHFIEALTDDISKEGIAISGAPNELKNDMVVDVKVKLPGMSTSNTFKAKVVWTQNARCGLQFIYQSDDKKIIAKAIEHYIDSHNVMDMILSNTARRSLKKALKKKMPEYMIPVAFVKLLDFPLNYNGKVDVKSLPPPKSVNELFIDEYVPANTKTEKELASIWKTLLSVKSVSMKDNFFDLGGNSITAAQLSINILKKFNITIPVKLLFDLSFIPVLAEYIDSKGKKYADRTSIQEDISRDRELSSIVQPTTNLTANISKPNNILLTGSSGFLGIFMLRELLRQTNAKIYCLIRQGQFESSAEKLQAAITKFKLEKDITLENKRIIVLPGDLSHDDFGLSSEHYQSLLNKIDLIYHCGAQVNIMASYGKLRGSNVEGTKEIIKFATSVQDKPIHYVSTLSSAYRKDKDGYLTEKFPTETYEHLFGGYAISKWVAEVLLTQINKRGLPVTIYRSGYIFGNSENGITNVNDALLMLIKGCIQLGIAPRIQERITLLPVDYVSRASVAISLAQGTDSDVYHIDHPTGLMWSDLVAWLNEYGYKIKLTSLKEWQSQLKKIKPENPLFPFLPYYLSLDEANPPPEVSVKKAERKLSSLSLSYPSINDDLLSTYIDYLCQVKFLPKPKSCNKKKIKST